MVQPNHNWRHPTQAVIHLPGRRRNGQTLTTLFRKPPKFLSLLLWIGLLTNVLDFRVSKPTSWQSPYRMAPGVFVLALEEENGATQTTTEHPATVRNLTLRKKQAPVTGPKPAPSHPGEALSMTQLLHKAGKRALGGGIPGALAGVIQVLSLMWLRTIVNYQCRYGTTFSQALRTLLQDGGVGRLYRGLGFALVQAPLMRFVSTAANDGVNLLLAHLSYTKLWGPGRTTVVASIVVGLFRILLMPIDTMKTVLQVDSLEGFRSLMVRVREGKLSVLYSGAMAVAMSGVLGHWPWFATYNWLSSNQFIRQAIPSKLLRNASIGIAASVVSDTLVNAMRVIKTTKQSLGSRRTTTYTDTIRIILAADGWKGLFGRGLRTRIMSNAIQSIVFTVVWRGLSDHWRRRNPDSGDAPAA